MPDQTTILSLPHILPSQAQKHVTHNEALRLLDVMVQLSVTGSSLAVPPALPALGDRYIVASGPSGAWFGHAKDIALWNGTAWEFFSPLRGWQAYDATAGQMTIFDGTAWVSGVGGGAAEFTQLGVSMAADATNRLAVESPASLFTNPTGSHQLAIDKDVSASTASLLLQQNFLTRAEIGLVGDNNLTVKVSPDGSAFTTALTIDKDTSRMTVAAPLRLEPAASDLPGLGDGHLWYNSTTGTFRARQAGTTVDVISSGTTSVFSDADFRLEDNLDSTKKAAFQLSGITPGTTRTYTLPDQTSTLAITSAAQTFTGTQTFAGTSVLLALNDTDAALGGAASARMQFLKSGGLGAIIGYNGATDFTQVVYDGNLTLAADHDNTEAASVINLMIDGVVVGQVEPNATAVTALSMLNGTKGDARYAQLAAANTFTGTFTASAATVSLGTSTAASTVNVGTGATLTAVTKAVNLGTGGVSGSTTNVNIGSAVVGALGTTTIASPTLAVNSGSVTMANATSVNLPSATTVGMGAANISAQRLGLGGATADATNRLSVNAPGVLFNHAGTGTELTLNKANSGDNAWTSFKTGFSTRAQFGLGGSDNFSLRVSSDGTLFNDAMTVEATSGGMTLAKPVILTGQSADPGSPVDGTIWYNSTSASLKARIGGETRLIDAQREVPFLMPVSGDHILSTMGSGTALATSAGAAGRVDLFPFMPRADIAVTGLSANCTTGVASALGKFVVYDSDANGRPNALIVETATVDFGTTGVKTATVALTMLQSRTYWLGLRTSSTATTSTWGANATPDINGGAPSTTSRKVLRRTITFANAAPTTWGFLSSEISSAVAPAIWLRV